MDSRAIRRKFLDFYQTRGHQEIPPSKLVLEDDPTTLFTSAGMQPLVPYLLGQQHPCGARLVNSQPSFRAADIEEVGDNRHTTFFEMLGNWSLGDYFKEEQLAWVWEFLTQELDLDIQKLHVSVFEGDKLIPKDEEAILIWKKLGIAPSHLHEYGAKKNWWSMSGTPEKMRINEIGGPDSEVFYDFGQDLMLHENSPFKNNPCHPNCDCGRFLEIGNSVFIQYQKKTEGKFHMLPQKNVDFGGGLERLVAATNNNPDLFQSDLYLSVIITIEKVTGKDYKDERNKKLFQVIADHLKAATFLIISQVRPSNKLHGYILRRLIRRAAVKSSQLDSTVNTTMLFQKIVESILAIYDGLLSVKAIAVCQEVKDVLTEEITKFSKTLDKGLKEIQKIEQINGRKAFDLYQTFGFPLEITKELFLQKGQKINHDEFTKEFAKHQQLSKSASAGVFKGGLVEITDQTTKYHTATHILHQALRTVLGNHILQRGSNITAQRLRFDFSHNTKLTDEQLNQVEELVNQQIEQDLPVSFVTTTKDEAVCQGAIGAFNERYIDPVRVYSIGNFSKEICGGPHVEHTALLGKFKIQKQESAGSGIRRIYAILT